ncbi:MAG: transposase [Verrucomicrobiaceae bacterium]|nr:transposase [Verrucomicrobiaceae bacterium]
MDPQSCRPTAGQALRVQAARAHHGAVFEALGVHTPEAIEEGLRAATKEVQAWLEQKYPQIAGSGQGGRAEIYWGDQTGVNNQPNAVRGYAPRGETPEIKQMSGRFGSSMMSAVSNRGSSRWMVYKGALDARLLIRFLERMVRSMQGRKVYLILDNLRVHHSKPVKEWLEQHQSRSRCITCPATVQSSIPTRGSTVR